MAAAQVYNPGRQIQSPLAGFIDVDQGGSVVASTFVASGTVTLNGATNVTVNNAAVTANSQILFTLKTVGGTVGAYPTIKSTVPGTSFTVAGTAADTSIYNYVIIG